MIVQGFNYHFILSRHLSTKKSFLPFHKTIYFFYILGEKQTCLLLKAQGSFAHFGIFSDNIKAMFHGNSFHGENFSFFLSYSLWIRSNFFNNDCTRF